METGMHIGTVVDEKSLNPLTEAIVKIMQQNCDQETIRHAISTLGLMARVEGVTIQHCHVIGDRSVSVNVDADSGETEITEN